MASQTDSDQLYALQLLNEELKALDPDQQKQCWELQGIFPEQKTDVCEARPPNMKQIQGDMLAVEVIDTENKQKEKPLVVVPDNDYDLELFEEDTTYQKQFEEDLQLAQALDQAETNQEEIPSAQAQQDVQGNQLLEQEDSAQALGLSDEEFARQLQLEQVLEQSEANRKKQFDAQAAQPTQQQEKQLVEQKNTSQALELEDEDLARQMAETMLKEDLQLAHELLQAQIIGAQAAEQIQQQEKQLLERVDAPQALALREEEIARQLEFEEDLNLGRESEQVEHNQAELLGAQTAEPIDRQEKQLMEEEDASQALELEDEEIARQMADTMLEEDLQLAHELQQVETNQAELLDVQAAERIQQQEQLLMEQEDASQALELADEEIARQLESAAIGEANIEVSSANQGRTQGAEAPIPSDGGQLDVISRLQQGAMPSPEDYEELLEFEAQSNAGKTQGLTREEIDSFPVMNYQGIPAGVSAKEEAARECKICMETFGIGVSLKMLPCFHSYHVECIDKWLEENTSCPVCRTEVNASLQRDN